MCCVCCLVIDGAGENPTMHFEISGDWQTDFRQLHTVRTLEIFSIDQLLCHMLLGRYVTSCCSAAMSHVAQLLCHMLLGRYVTSCCSASMLHHVGCYVTCCSAALSHVARPLCHMLLGRCVTSCCSAAMSHVARLLCHMLLSRCVTCTFSTLKIARYCHVVSTWWLLVLESVWTSFLNRCSLGCKFVWKWTLEINMGTEITPIRTPTRRFHFHPIQFLFHPHPSLQNCWFINNGFQH